MFSFTVGTTNLLCALTLTNSLFSPLFLSPSVSLSPFLCLFSHPPFLHIHLSPLSLSFTHLSLSPPLFIFLTSSQLYFHLLSAFFMILSILSHLSLSLSPSGISVPLSRIFYSPRPFSHCPSLSLSLLPLSFTDAFLAGSVCGKHLKPCPRSSSSSSSSVIRHVPAAPRGDPQLRRHGAGLPQRAAPAGTLL